MGLDISVGIIDEDKWYQKIDEQNIDTMKFELSRQFCNLQCRQNVISHETEMKQIGRLTQIDIIPIEQMSWYLRDREMEDQLFFYDSEEEKENFKEKVKNTNEQVLGNLVKVKNTVKELISKLSQIDDLPSKLLKTDFDTMNNQRYFSKFNENLGDGYIGNNFGQDLRNLLKLIEFAESLGEDTVFFEYG